MFVNLIQFLSFFFFSLYSDKLIDDDLIERLKNNPKIVNLLKSSSLVSILREVVEKQNSLLQNQNCFGQENWQQTFLKDYIIKFSEFRELVEELIEML